jgi:uncharacterized membrane protein YfcA
MPSPFLLIPLGFLIGTFGTLVGAGGGFILIPTFLLLAPEMDPAKLTALSLAVIFFNAVSGSIAYARKKRIDYKAGLAFAAASIPGAIIGAYFVQYLPRKTFDPIFGASLIVVAFYLFLKPLRNQHLDTSALKIENFKLKKESMLLGIVLSLGVGFFSSLLGIGGGIIHVPTLVNILGYPVHFATATSQFVMVFMAGAGTLTHLYHGDLNGLEIEMLCLAPSVILGAQLGAYLSEKIHGHLIIRSLAVALAVVGFRLVST